MKRIALVSVVLAAAVGTGYATYPDEFMLYAVVAAKAGLRVWEAVEANPAPVLLAVGTFLLTIVYHKAKGKSLRESVEVAATRVTLVPVVREGGEENAVVRRAKARATRAQLIADQIALQNRQRKLPAVVSQAEKETCYTERGLADAEKALADKRKAHDEAVAKLEALRKEQAEADAELAEIEVELQKLAELV